MKKNVGKLTLGKATLKNLAAIDKVAAGNLPPVSIGTGYCDSAAGTC